MNDSIPSKHSVPELPQNPESQAERLPEAMTTKSVNPEHDVVLEWGQDELLAFLRSKRTKSIPINEDHLEIIKQHNIIGRTFLELKLDDFLNMGLVYGRALDFALIVSELNVPPFIPWLASIGVETIQKSHPKDIQADHGQLVQDIVESPPSFAMEVTNTLDSPKESTGDPDIVNPSVVLYHKAFGRFYQEFNDVNAAITPQQYRRAEELSSPYLPRDSHSSLHPALTPILGRFVHQVNPDQASLDGVWAVEAPTDHVVAQVKIQFGNKIKRDEHDTATQSNLTYRRSWTRTRTRGIRLCCCCPSFLIAISGPSIMVLGAAFTDSIVVEPLTCYIPFAAGAGYKKQLQRLARLLRALEIGIDDLGDFYWTLDMRPTIHRSFPYICEYKSTKPVIRFTYSCKLVVSDTKLLWVARTEDDRDVVIKFVQKYNGVAHRLLAVEGLAPELLYDGTDHSGDFSLGGWKMVVMAYVPQHPWPKTALGQIYRRVKDAVEILHKNDIVFGDLRSPNVLVVKEGEEYKGMLVDFDWCGRNGATTYPMSLNPEVRWPPGVKKGTLLDKKHDIELLQRLPNELIDCTFWGIDSI